MDKLTHGGRRPGAGRKLGSGPASEPTKPIRLPLSQVDTVLAPQRADRDRLMQVLDRANARWGRGTIGIGAAGVTADRVWSMQRGLISPTYTTDWRHVREIQ